MVLASLISLKFPFRKKADLQDSKFGLSVWERNEEVQWQPSEGSVVEAMVPPLLCCYLSSWLF